MQHGASTTINYNEVNANPRTESGSPLRDALSVTETQVESLHRAISELEQRLETVLLPLPPAALEKAAPPTPHQPMSPVRDRVGQMNNGYMHAVDRINELRRRVDV